MAARAGAVVADLEFVQFHPTALDVDEDPRPLLTEALRGQGAWLVDEAGRRFVGDVHPDGELAPRDIVSRAIWLHQSRGHRVFLDARAAVGDVFPGRFPTVFDACRRHGLDPRREPIPVTPAAHYHMGGIAVDARGRTSLDGLWACGEAACTGVHGANRLASNSLLEGLVFGAGVAADILAGGNGRSAAAVVVSGAPCGSAAAADRDRRGHDSVTAAVRDVMWENVGLVRDARGLDAAVVRLATLSDQATEFDARNLALVGRLIATAAAARLESRGGHYRADFPSPREAWRHRLFWRLRDDGAIEPVARPSSLDFRMTEHVA
jgi:L-aspartate oxidase